MRTRDDTAIEERLRSRHDQRWAFSRFTAYQLCETVICVFRTERGPARRPSRQAVSPAAFSPTPRFLQTLQSEARRYARVAAANASVVSRPLSLTRKPPELGGVENALLMRFAVISCIHQQGRTRGVLTHIRVAKGDLRMRAGRDHREISGGEDQKIADTCEVRTVMTPAPTAIRITRSAAQFCDGATPYAFSTTQQSSKQSACWTSITGQPCLQGAVRARAARRRSPGSRVQFRAGGNEQSPRSWLSLMRKTRSVVTRMPLPMHLIHHDPTKSVRT